MWKTSKISTGFVFFVVFNIFFDPAKGRPVEPPTKFSLNTSPQRTDQKTPAKWDQGTELLGRVGDALRLGSGKLVDSATAARNVITKRTEDLTSEARNNVARIVAAKTDILSQGSTAINSLVGPPSFENIFPTKTREFVRLENENDQSLFERQKSNPIGIFLENYVNPIPLVDKIRDDEKYGNSGDKFIGIGRALVNGFEGLSNLLNAIVDFPMDAAKKTSRRVTEVLNQLGGRLVGLQ